MKTSFIPTFDEINGHYEAVGASLRTRNPDFHIARLEDLDSEVVIEMPPYRNSFYEIILGQNASELDYQINDFQFSSYPNFLLFSAPNQVHSWRKKGSWQGYVVSFKLEFLKSYNENFLSEFPFFSINEANFLKLESNQIDKFGRYLAELYEEQENERINSQKIIQANLIALLHVCRRTYEEQPFNQIHPKRRYSLVAQYQFLINCHFSEWHQVKDYANKLNISANHLTQVIIQTTDRSAKSFIIDRLLLEARYLLSNTGLDISEIAYHLNFNSPTHFGQFFKKYEGIPPTTYRKHKIH